ncbi:ImmA/IrrE family metallo-endopeptidase [Streptomyces sp. NBC_01142]|uniref:ImmA/IrrE family metallo-endopeptidase n=1 Tax=Streptomyces sp. NBC_01142 TaxID=2975865 RepID=UPI00224E36DD|nr:ImmA/IrrE family metallo-endopeptidase [Streptomyces sp. NBC_01142]MCX4826852.1 ImmA/IrrE family metallo-endopeptidase [Streptomyces sp. NBC_01142]
MIRGRFAAEAPKQAEAMLGVLLQRHPGTLPGLQQDPLDELDRWSEVQVSLEPESGESGRCSVAGSYQHQTRPPTLVVGTARSRRRRGFTALHELGHHLQKTDTGLGNNLFARQDSEAFEEAACDAFAARILLPDLHIAESVRRSGPTAPDAVEMFQASRASREACCVRASQYLPGGGAVVLLDAAGTVLFAAASGLIPPARGTDQSTTPLIAAALQTAGTSQRDRTYVLWRSGDRSDLLYGQAAWFDEEYLVAVLAEDNVPWRKLTAPRPESGTSRYRSWWTCETCQEEFRVIEAGCPECGQPRCEEGHCGCRAAHAQQDRTCDECRLVLAPARFAGASTSCRDCS